MYYRYEATRNQAKVRIDHDDVIDHKPKVNQSFHRKKNNYFFSKVLNHV